MLGLKLTFLVGLVLIKSIFIMGFWNSTIPHISDGIFTKADYHEILALVAMFETFRLRWEDFCED